MERLTTMSLKRLLKTTQDANSKVGTSVARDPQKSRGVRSLPFTQEDIVAQRGQLSCHVGIGLRAKPPLSYLLPSACLERIFFF